MKKLAEDIKNKEFNNIYLLMGSEGYLRKQYVSKLKSSICGDNTMNLNVFKGPGQNLDEITDLANTMPFFTDKRVISIEDAKLFELKKGEDEGTDSKEKTDPKSKKNTPIDSFITMLSEIPESTVIIFSEETADKRSRLYKAVKKLGSITEFNTQEDETLVKWIMSLAKNEGKSISSKDASYIIERVGRDMTLLKSEWDKLCGFCLNESMINKEHIDMICIRTVEDKVFDMIDAMSVGNGKRAFVLYDDLLSLNTAAMKILALLVRHFRILYDVSVYAGSGLPRNEMASKLGLRPFFIGKYMDQAKRYGKERLKKALESCAETDHDIKSGKIKDVLGVELLIARYSN